jgi:GGDEF domain-containing protein
MKYRFEIVDEYSGGEWIANDWRKEAFGFAASILHGGHHGIYDLRVVPCEDVEKMTIERDKLTGLPNKRAFDESEPSLFVAITDVNGQGHFNDHNGHAAGDILIKRLGEILVSFGLDVYRNWRG